MLSWRWVIYEVLETPGKKDSGVGNEKEDSCSSRVGKTLGALKPWNATPMVINVVGEK